jgi:hypothetical protein
MPVWADALYLSYLFTDECPHSSQAMSRPAVTHNYEFIGRTSLPSGRLAVYTEKKNITAIV